MALELAFDDWGCDAAAGVTSAVRAEEDDIFVLAWPGGHFVLAIFVGGLGAIWRVDEAVDQLGDVVVAHGIDKGEGWEKQHGGLVLFLSVFILGTLEIRRGDHDFLPSQHCLPSRKKIEEHTYPMSRSRRILRKRLHQTPLVLLDLFNPVRLPRANQDMGAEFLDMAVQRLRRVNLDSGWI